MIRYFFDLLNGGGGVTGTLVFLVLFVFQVWMFVDAIRRQEYIWAALIFFFSVLSALIYFFMVYRAQGGGNPFAGFEWPGAADRRRIKELQAEIHHLDRPHHHMQLGDIYLHQGNLAKAEGCYRAAFERDSKDEDIRAHLGTCLAQQKKWQEALPLLESVCAENPKHDYGSTLMALGETEAALGRDEKALAIWQQVLTLYTYSRARVNYAELLIKKKDYAEARKQLQEVIDDEPYSAKFQRKQEEVWFHRAKSLMGTIPG